MLSFGKVCDYCGEPADKNEELVECDSCEFVGHDDHCLEEHHLTNHEVTSEENTDDYLGGTEQDF